MVKKSRSKKSGGGKKNTALKNQVEVKRILP